MQEWQLEMASKLEEDERNLRLKEVSAKAFPDTLLTPDKYKALDCQECGEPLIEFRMQRGCLKCVECEDRSAKKARFFGQN